MESRSSGCGKGVLVGRAGVDGLLCPGSGATVNDKQGNCIEGGCQRHNHYGCV